MTEKRPSWLHGKREVEGEESQFLVRKRPSWFAGRSFKQPSRAKKPSFWSGRALKAQESSDEIQALRDLYNILNRKRSNAQ